MHPEIKENYVEKLRLATLDKIDELENKFKAMLALHSAKGRLGSGDTIKKTMDYIAQGNADLYQVTIDHLQSLKPEFHPQLEHEVQALAKSAQESFKTESLIYFQKSTEHARNPKLYERLLPDVEANMEAELAKFKNSLNAAVLQLKLNNHMPPFTKFLWGIEAVLLLISMFIAGMWYKEPTGNYEPILVILGLIIPLIAVGIKFGAKKAT
ncbi:hypothetical protein [Oceanicoccus sp. KOV_DT_Chl]|uniref:hypothetical protein n=1 Tax=Oceanicoccus sp. KOV_DT_Chl TaxID=1904639 RepID=UPI000C796FCB|nr:hypothetical protein [Oceanicoccus sp. KOV_DT_Chl]